MEKVREAVNYYNSLLEKSTETLTQTRDQLHDRAHEQKMIFGGRPLSPYLRPHFVSAAQWRYLQDVCRIVWRCIEKMGGAIKDSPALQDQLGIREDERDLVAIDPGFTGISVTSRLDSFLSGNGMEFVELNGESPAGISYAEVVGRIFMDLPIMQEFAQRFTVTPLYARQHLLDTLLRAYREWCGTTPSAQPQLAIVDLKGLPTQCEFEQFQEFFQRQGYQAIIASPDELEFRDGKLWRGDYRIDLIYRRLLVNEFLDHYQVGQALLQAYRQRAVCVVNSFRAKFVHKKMLFGLLTDEVHGALFTPEEQAAIQRHIPWTRRLADNRTNYRGQTIELLDFTRQQQQQLVIKPNDEYGGKGVFVGWELNPSEWDAAIQTALQGDYLVQQRVTTAKEVFPYYDETGQISFLEQLVDLDPLLFYGEVHGAFTRLSSTALCNVTSGGGMVPTMIVD
jgi:uncharacterized circularly permuted ATP-grasp superfamily protein